MFQPLWVNQWKKRSDRYAAITAFQTRCAWPTGYGVPEWNSDSACLIGTSLTSACQSGDFYKPRPSPATDLEAQPFRYPELRQPGQSPF